MSELKTDLSVPHEKKRSMALFYRTLMLKLFVGGMGLFLVLVLIFRYLWTGNSKKRSYIINLTVVGFTFCCMLFIIEMVFYFFITPSDSFNFTLSSKRWMKKYWTPINSLGYRDNEPSKSQFIGKDILFVVGDSIVAGHGINNYKDRFSNIIQQELGEKWLVVNIAKNGWNTVDEFKAISSYPYKPKAIILSYYINDIYHAADKIGFKMPVLFEQPSAITAPYLYCSYAFNYFYWRLFRFRNTYIGLGYWKYLKKCFFNQEVWQIHKQEILDVVDYTKNHNIKLIVVLFPHLKAIEASKVLISKVADLMIHHHVDYIDLSVKYAGMDSKKLVVNSLDAHPNEKVHREVGELLLNRIRKMDTDI